MHLKKKQQKNHQVEHTRKPPARCVEALEGWFAPSKANRLKAGDARSDSQASRASPSPPTNGHGAEGTSRAGRDGAPRGCSARSGHRHQENTIYIGIIKPPLHAEQGIPVRAAFCLYNYHPRALQTQQLPQRRPFSPSEGAAAIKK